MMMMKLCALGILSSTSFDLDIQYDSIRLYTDIPNPVRRSDLCHQFVAPVFGADDDRLEGGGQK